MSLGNSSYFAHVGWHHLGILVVILMLDDTTLATLLWIATLVDSFCPYDRPNTYHNHDKQYQNRRCEHRLRNAQPHCSHIMNIYFFCIINEINDVRCCCWSTLKYLHSLHPLTGRNKFWLYESLITKAAAIRFCVVTIRWSPRISEGWNWQK